MIISSQQYRDQEIVDEKIASLDFTVTLATIFDANGTEYKVVVDGHHSLEAAIQTWNKPEYEEADYNYQSEVESIGFDSFLEAHYIDSEWVNVEENTFAF